MARIDGSDPVRLGRIEFVNCFPLYHHLERELAARGFEASIVEGDPATLNGMLVRGEIDVALPSSIAFARHADELALLPQVSISSFGAVDSVQLFTSIPLAQVRRIAVTAKSATSVCLLRILCDAWGITPEFCVRQGPLAEVLARFDALLLIGDEALHVLRAEVFPCHIDLGEAWRQLTGLPMVFAVSAARKAFVARRPAVAAAVSAAFLASRNECAAHPVETAAAAALRYEFSQGFLLEYFDKLKFGFTPEHRAGLEEFYRRAVVSGQLETAPVVAGQQPSLESTSATSGVLRALSSNHSREQDLISGLIWREALPCDAAEVAGAIDEWWPGHHIVHGVCPQLFAHLGDTSLIVEDGAGLAGFLVGYLSQRQPDAGYIHYAGVRPELRGHGVGRELYRRFAELVQARGRSRVVAETGVWNRASIAFHRQIGFRLQAGDGTVEVDGLPVRYDTTGMGCDYVEMVLTLNAGVES